MGRFATVAERRATTADKRGRLFTKLSREISIAARSNPDPEKNPRLRLAIQKARQANMPVANIQRAIQKSSGAVEDEGIEELLYEAIGASQSSYLIEVRTDNKNRSHSEIRQIVQKHGAHLTSQGSVSWNYEREAHIWLKAPSHFLEQVIDELLNEYDLKDYQIQNDEGILIVAPDILESLLESLWKYPQLLVEEYEVLYQPKETVSLQGADQVQHDTLYQKLKEHPDVQMIYHNVVN